LEELKFTKDRDARRINNNNNNSNNNNNNNNNIINQNIFIVSRTFTQSCCTF